MLYNIKIAIAYVVEKQYLCSRIINPLIITIMTKKLTKNVCISQEVTDVIVMLEMFEKILYKHELWFDYFYWFDKCHCVGACKEMFTLWKSWAKSRHPKMWSSQAFIWEATDIAYPKWYEIDKEWCTWLDQNLKK